MSQMFVDGVVGGSTSRSIDIVLRKTAANTELTGIAYNTSGNIASYHRQGAARTAITLATQTVTGAFSSGGFVEIDNTNAKGLYRLDVPDAAWATGVDYVTISFFATGGYWYHERFALAGNVPQTGDSYARLGAPAGASVSADLAAVKSDTAAAKASTAGLTFTVANVVDANVADWKGSTAPANTGDAFARLGAPAGASVSADVAAIKAVLPTALDANGFIKADVEDWKGATAPANTGDAFARLGAPAGASVSADIATANAAIALTATEAEAVLIYNRIGAPAGASVSADIAAVTADVVALPAPLSAAGTRSAVGLAAANLDTQLGNTFARIGAPVGASLSADVASVTADVVALPTATVNADTLLNRDMSVGTDSGSSTVRTVRQALRALRNKVDTSVIPAVVYKEDDTTTSWTTTLTTSLTAEPIVTSDPAGP